MLRASTNTSSIQTGANPHAPYYPALDGLRAIAVLAVFFGHYAHFVLGGWGVDIFFALSGFLITGILYDARDIPHRFRNFYIRRTLRIFPAYYLFWLLLLILTPLVHIAWHPIDLLWPSYLGNWIPLIFPNSIFNLTAYPLHQHPTIIYTGHFWTLCVEEQFYLLWPLVIFKVRKRSTLIRICAVTVVALPLIRTVMAHTLSQQLDQLGSVTFLRLDEFLLGGLAALTLRGTKAPQLCIAAPYLFITGAAALTAVGLYSHYVLRLATNLLNDQSRIMSFGITLVDIPALGLILMCLNAQSLLTRFLSLAPLRALGRLSYGFYIWHEIPHAFYEHAIRAAGLSPRGLGLIIPFTGTLILALASYYLVERPFLKLKPRFDASRTLIGNHPDPLA